MSTFRPPSTLHPLDALDADGAAKARAPEPGLVLVYAEDRAVCAPFTLTAAGQDIGREHPTLAAHSDGMMSRRHARLAFSGSSFALTDLGSRNGSALDGKPVTGSVLTDSARVLRLGHSLFLLCPNILPFQQYGVHLHDRRVEGPALQQALRSVAAVATHSRTLFVAGESGAGKESMAQAFHRAGPQRQGPFVAVNCATIPQGVAERLLFGAQKGAYSGASSDSEGYLQAANGGTLFFDEVADLDLTVQAKLLRVLESGEVTPLGATRPRKVDLRICCATNLDLRLLVREGKFRADLFFRLGMPQVDLPPLRQRMEEIPWHVLRAIRTVHAELRAEVSLVESCLLRAWPGNVRELEAEVKTASIAAQAAGRHTVGVVDLRAEAGAALRAEPAESAQPPMSAAASGEIPTREKLRQALFAAHGNISAAARALGMHRTQVRRLITRYKLDASLLREVK